MLDAKLLEILACPACRGPVTPDDNHQWLYCSACSLRYRVQDDIPIMLVDEAEKCEPQRPAPGESS
ncbi:hypothetical protein CO151_05560 [bacterium CG_4_9_14_3_um_filter_65_15]|nr:MAG: hypothetical protein CO151_05560 [bacterium CG_4_9_14_3_um_filter_65_15]